MLSRRRRRRAAGFSLIELMVVIAIMGLLATVVALNLMGQTYKAKGTKVAADFDTMKKAIQMFKINVGRYPQQLSELWQAPGNAKGWMGPYIDPNPKDPWGNDYVYQPPLSSGHFLITSYGADGVAGGTGENQDLTSDNIGQVDFNAGQ